MCDKQNTQDSRLLQILQEEKNLVKFFDTVFGFLSRRTDFYYISKSAQDPVGLPEGFAEKIVYEALMKYKPKELKDGEIPDYNMATNEHIVDHEEVCVTNNEAVTKNEDNQTTQQNVTTNQLKEQKPAVDSYNGAVYEKYSWSQNITDLDVQLTLPSDLSSRDLNVSILTTHISVKNKRTNEILLDGDLHRKVKAADSFWSIDKNYLQIHLEKQSESWWEKFLVAEPLLNLQQMDCSRPFDDLPDVAQAKIEQLRWDVEQKMRGLPTSKELEQHNTLRKAWDMEGSPFKGTPYDPTLVTFEGQS